MKSTGYSRYKKQLLFLAFAAVDFFAAVEVTALMVAAPNISEYFNGNSEGIAWILNSYLYAVFVALVVLYYCGEMICARVRARTFFLFGLSLFFAGSVAGALSFESDFFYAARITQGVGAAMAFVGQLWVMTQGFKNEIQRPLLWTETGAATGVVAGPFLGGIFSDMGVWGWRMIFGLNAAVVLFAMAVTLLVYSDVSNRKVSPAKKLRADFYIALSIIVLVVALAVASEFSLSVFLQHLKQYSATGAGLVLFSGSVGLIFGSAFAARVKTKKQQHIMRGLWGMLGTSVCMGLIFFWGWFVLAPVLFFLIGFCYGFLNVVLYVYIARMLPQSSLVKGITAYLIALQLGTLFGVFLEDMWGMSGYDFRILMLLLSGVSVVAIFLGAQLAYLKNIDGDVYEIAPIRKTPFYLARNIASECINMFQTLFYISIVLPFGHVMNTRVSGKESLEIDSRTIIIANHGARLDVFIILSGMGLQNFLKLNPLRFPTDKRVYEIPFVRFFFRGIGMYKIEPKGDLDKSLEDTFRYIDKAHSMVFFPEGRMVKKGETSEPKKGISHIIRHKDITILPVKIVYASHNKKGRGNMWRARVIFGHPIHASDIRSSHHKDHWHHAAMEYVHAIGTDV